jgi:hypothetical protein
MRNIMIYRIAMWANAGLLVSVGWGLYFASTNKALPIEPIVYILASVTQPTAAVALHLKLVDQFSLTWIVVVNAATYALLGLVVETLRRHYRSLHILN